MPGSGQVRYQDYPFVGFSFMVKFLGLSVNDECNFKEISGLNVTLDTEDIREGGENRFAHRIPSRPKYQNLILKRGMYKYSDAGLVQWAQQCITTFAFKPKSLNIMLLDENQAPLATWNVVNAYPVSIKVSEFKSMTGEIVIETLELAFDYFTRTN